jgi:hypothetical protein
LCHSPPPSLLTHHTQIQQDILVKPLKTKPTHPANPINPINPKNPINPTNPPNPTNPTNPVNPTNQFLESSTTPKPSATIPLNFFTTEK